ncbi:MAG: xanthine dehydrogenase accessory protein XdhC [Aquitalea sp.]|nr:xanthine dehydrogenase accessory protein XdhC [Aquitalea sp.]
MAMLLDGDWLSVLRQHLARQEHVILITVAGSHGHVPREVGARMVVGRDWYADTLGGGRLEYQACLYARQLLAGMAAHRSYQRFELWATPDYCCTGTVWLLFERLACQDLSWVDMAWQARAQGQVLRRMITLDATTPPEYQLLQGTGSGIRLLQPLLVQDDLPAPAMRVVLCGAGHVGRAVSRLLGSLPCRVFWLDNRPGLLPTTVPSNTTVILGGTEQMVLLPADACWLVMTHSDQQDFDWVEQILLRNDARYIGLLGCHSKLASFNLRLINRVPLGSIARLRCPPGVAGIDSKQPAAIAIAVVAELLQQTKSVSPC